MNFTLQEGKVLLLLLRLLLGNPGVQEYLSKRNLNRPISTRPTKLRVLSTASCKTRKELSELLPLAWTIVAAWSPFIPVCVRFPSNE